MSPEPQLSKSAATPASTADSSLTSIATAMALPPARLISSAAACAAASWRSAMTTCAPSVAKRLAISSPMPLAAPVMIATLPLRHAMVNSFRTLKALLRSVLLRKVIVYDFAQPERQIGDQVSRRNHVPDRKTGDRRQRMGMKLECCWSRPRTLQHDVFEIVANELADPRRAVDVWDDLQEESRLVERPHDRSSIELAVLEAHRASRDPDGSVVQCSDQGVAIDLQIRARQLFRKAPQLASAGNRRMIVQKHEVDIAAHVTANSYRDHLTGLGVVAEPRAVRHADELVLDGRLDHLEGLGDDALQRIDV